MRLRASLPPERLFVYGTLRDADLFALVAGAPLRRFRPQPALLLGAVALESEEAFSPVLARTGGGASGLLIRGLNAASWRRIVFYEGEDYRLAGARVRLSSNRRCIGATVFGPTHRLATRARRWSLAAWQRRHKAAALTAAERYMAYLDRPGADLDHAWEGIKASVR